MTTADKLITVAENVPKVYHAGQLNVIENTSTLKKSVSGSAILIDDVSPVTHDMGVKVRGKNLLDINQAKNSGVGNDFDTFSISNNTITATSNNSKITSVMAALFKGELPAGDYVLSLNAVIENTPNHRRPNEILVFKNGSVITLNNTMQTDGTYSPTLKFTLSEKANIKISFYKNITFSSETVSDTVYKVTLSDIQLELGTTATAYTPYVPDLTAVKVTRCGKNLFNQYAQSQLFKGYRGIDITHIQREVTNNGTRAMFSVSLKEGGTIQQGISFGLLYIPKDTSVGAQAFWFQNSSSTDFERKSFSLGSNYPYDGAHTNIVGIYPSTIANWEAVTSNYNIQIEWGSVATDYEPYVGAEYTPNADGTVNGVTSLYPNTSLMTNTDGVMIDCTYYKDIYADEVVTRTMTSYSNPKIKVVGNSAFQSCSALTTVNFPVATSIGNSAFSSCSKLTTVNFPVATSIGNSAFSSCSALTTVDFPVATSIGQYAFRNCSALTRIILRNNSICSLSSTTAFIGCTHISGNDGFIYVPSILIDEYKTATNWVTYASKFRALEDYTVDGTTTGALDESKVSA